MARKKKETWQDALAEAVKEAGGFSALARLTGYSHVAFIKALRQGQKCSPEMALAIDKHTSVAKHRLCPNIWSANE